MTRISNDMVAIANITEHKIFRTSKYGTLPVDFDDLVQVLRKFNTKLYPLVQNHTCFESAPRKWYLFTIIYDRLMVIKTTDNSMYTRILNAITLTYWVHSAMKNVHLHELLRFQKNVYSLSERITALLTNKVVRYSPTK